jgi:hypothetical protein
MTTPKRRTTDNSGAISRALESPLGRLLVVPFLVASLMWSGNRLFGGVESNTQTNAVQAQQMADNAQARKDMIAQRDREGQDRKDDIRELRTEMITLIQTMCRGTK